MKQIYITLILSLGFSRSLLASPQLQNVIALQQSKLQAQQATIQTLLKEINELKTKVNEQNTAVANLAQTVAGKILYADPPIGGWYDSFDLDRSADQWCKSQGYLGGVANHQAQGNNRGLFCFR